MTEGELFRALATLYPSSSHALLPQVGNATGARCHRHVDALAIGLWPSHGMLIEGFEIKCSRGDWKRELADPEKSDSVARYCDRWHVVAADVSIVDKDELPPAWGLLVWDEKSAKLKTKVRAKPLEAIEPRREFIAAICRALAGCATPEAQITAAKILGNQEGRVLGRAENDYERSQHRVLVDNVKTFEAASGIDIIHAWQHAKVGALVRRILNGDVERDEERLVALRAEITRIGVVVDASLERLGRKMPA